MRYLIVPADDMFYGVDELTEEHDKAFEDGKINIFDLENKRGLVKAGDDNIVGWIEIPAEGEFVAEEVA